MKTAALLILLVAGAPFGASEDPITTTSLASRFATVDLFVDPHDNPLAAYQLEFVADRARVTLVGIEGGEHPAYAQPPYYDPKALSGNRVILAALSTATDLPRSRTRVATLHLRVTGGDTEPTYEAKLEVAGNPQGKPIAADMTVGQGAK